MTQLVLFEVVCRLCQQRKPLTPPLCDPCRTRIAAAKAWSRGHTCERCGHGCGDTEHHIACCGTERQHRRTIGSYCEGHPCPACSATGSSR